MPPILKDRFNFTLRWLLDLGNTFLEQNLKLKTLGYLLFIASIFLSAVWLPNDQILTVIEEIVLLIQFYSLHLGYLFLAQRWLRGVGALHLIECLVGFDHNASTHLATPTIRKKYFLQTCTQFL